MSEEIKYSFICGNQVTLVYDECDYEVRLNGVPIMTTGDEIEASMVAEAIDTALTVLNAQNSLVVR